MENVLCVESARGCDRRLPVVDVARSKPVVVAESVDLDSLDRPTLRQRNMVLPQDGKNFRRHHLIVFAHDLTSGA